MGVGWFKQQNYKKVQKKYEPTSPLALFKLLFDEELVYQIIEFTNLYEKREKVESTIELLNEKFRLFLTILLLSGYYKLPERQKYLETTPYIFV